MSAMEIGFVVRRVHGQTGAVTWLSKNDNWRADRREALLYSSRHYAHLVAREGRVRSAYDDVTIRVVRLMVRVPG
jgi:hypothetical protein